MDYSVCTFLFLFIFSVMWQWRHTADSPDLELCDNHIVDPNCLTHTPTDTFVVIFEPIYLNNSSIILATKEKIPYSRLNLPS